LNKNLRLNTIKIEPIKNNEPFSRYILNSNQSYRLKNIVKLSAFMPAPNLQLSVILKE